MDKGEREKLRNMVNGMRDIADVQARYPGVLDTNTRYAEMRIKELAALLDHIDALEGDAADVIACWDKVYPDADAKKIGITQDELEDMEFGPVNKLRKAIASAQEAPIEQP